MAKVHRAATITNADLSAFGHRHPEYIRLVRDALWDRQSRDEIAKMILAEHPSDVGFLPRDEKPALRPSQVEVITEEWDISHGGDPRGRGSWAFAFGSRDAKPEFIPGSLLFSEARKEAKRLAAERGIDAIWVLP